MSNDAEQYLTDTIAEDVVSRLARFHELTVIARYPSFQYRDKSVDVKRLVADLGVHFIVEGSVRRSDDSIGITVQLIDAQTAGHLWTERFDVKPADVFSVLDEMVQAIVANVVGRLRPCR